MCVCAYLHVPLTLLYLIPVCVSVWLPGHAPELQLTLPLPPLVPQTEFLALQPVDNAYVKTKDIIPV